MTDFRLTEPSLSQSGGLVPLLDDRFPTGTTVARLRYPGGDRPVKPPCGSRIRITDALDTRNERVVFQRTPELALRAVSYLHIRSLIPLQSCSKGAQGLSV